MVYLSEYKQIFRLGEINMSNKKALIIVDMQNDYLWNRRKKMFSYNTPELVNAVNSLISEFRERGDDVIYVGQVFPNIITNKCQCLYSEDIFHSLLHLCPVTSSVMKYRCSPYIFYCLRNSYISYP